MITPLVAVNAMNEESFKTKWMASNQGKNAALENLGFEQRVRMAEASAAAVQSKELELRIAELQKNGDSKVAEVTRLQGELALARGGQEEINARIGMMAETQQAQQKLGETLVAELRSLRTRAVDAERQSVDLEEELGIIRSNLEVAEAARRALQEEVQQLNDERDQAVDKIARYVAYIGELPSARPALRLERSPPIEIFPPPSSASAAQRVPPSRRSMRAAVTACRKAGFSPSRTAVDSSATCGSSKST